MKYIILMLAVVAAACCKKEEASSVSPYPSAKHNEEPCGGVIPDSIAYDTVGFIRFPQPSILNPLTFYYNKKDSEHTVRDGCVITTIQGWTRYRVEMYNPPVVTPVNVYSVQTVYVIPGCIDQGDYVYIPD